MSALIREFNTPNFRVVVDAIEESHPDISHDDTSETRDKLASGEWVLFCARVRVIHRKVGELSADYLGNCIYTSIHDFQDHRKCAAYQRELRRKPGQENVCVGSYFADMIRQAIRDARIAVANMPDKPKLRVTF